MLLTTSRIAIVVMCGALAYGVAVLRRPTQPTLSAPEEIEIGIRARGTAAVISIDLRNDGQLPLKLNQFQSSCGCIAVTTENGAAVDRDTALLVEPQSTLGLTARFNVREVSGDQFHAFVQFASNDPQKPVARVNIVGKVQGFLTATPTELNLPQCRTRTSVDREIVLLDTGLSEAPQVSRVTSSHPNVFAVSFKPFSPNRESGNRSGRPVGLIDVKVGSCETPMDIAGEITVFLQESPTPALRLPVRIVILASLQVIPARLVLPRTVGESKSFSAAILCKHLDGLAIKLAQLEVPDGLTVEFEGVHNTPWQRITVKWHPELDKPGTGPVKRIVRLTATYGSFVEQIAIPVTCLLPD